MLTPSPIEKYGIARFVGRIIWRGLHTLGPLPMPLVQRRINYVNISYFMKIMQWHKIPYHYIIASPLSLLIYTWSMTPLLSILPIAFTVDIDYTGLLL